MKTVPGYKYGVTSFKRIPRPDPPGVPVLPGDPPCRMREGVTGDDLRQALIDHCNCAARQLKRAGIKVR